MQRVSRVGVEDRTGQDRTGEERRESEERKGKREALIVLDAYWSLTPFPPLTPHHSSTC